MGKCRYPFFDPASKKARIRQKGDANQKKKNAGYVSHAVSPFLWRCLLLFRGCIAFEPVGRHRSFLRRETQEEPKRRPPAQKPEVEGEAPPFRVRLEFILLWRLEPYGSSRCYRVLYIPK